MKKPIRNLKPEDTELDGSGFLAPMRHNEGRGLEIQRKDVLSDEEKDFLQQIGHLLEKLKWGEGLA